MLKNRLISSLHHLAFFLCLWWSMFVLLAVSVSVCVFFPVFFLALLAVSPSLSSPSWLCARATDFDLESIVLG